MLCTACLNLFLLFHWRAIKNRRQFIFEPNKQQKMTLSTSQAELLRNFIAEITFTEIEKINYETLIFEEGIFDSLGFLSLVSFLQDEFGVEIDGEDLNEENFESINAIVNFINSKNSQDFE
jgi:acyl carrier protein